MTGQLGGKTLTPKQLRFVEEYLVDLNASAAARRAGYSERTADAIGRENLGKPTVAAAIQTCMAERAERTKINADWLLLRLAQEADADLADLYDENGSLKPVKDWPLVWRQGLIAGIETVQAQRGVDDEGNPNWVTVDKVKLSDRVKRLEMIGRHVGVQAFRERVEHSGPNGGPIPVAATELTDEQLATIAATGRR